VYKKLYLIDFQRSVILQSLIAKLMRYQNLTAISCSSEGKTLLLNLIGDIQGRCGDTYANYGGRPHLESLGTVLFAHAIDASSALQ
jgi:hypothetical protein